MQEQGQPSAQDRQPGNKAALKEVITLLKRVKLNAYTYSDTEKAELWRSINRKINRHLVVRRWMRAAVAAACLIGVALGGWYVADRHQTVAQPELQTLVVPRGETDSLLLADGTKVWVNSESAVRYPDRFDGDKREITVEGEVYLEVAHNVRKPFVVHTQSFDVRVLGTKFGISSYNGEETHSVVLAQGKVEVYSQRLNTTVRLHPNELFTQQRDSCYTADVNAYNYISWKDGILYLESLPLSVIATKLERHYAVGIRPDKEIANLICCGKIVLFDDLCMTLDNITDVLPITYKRQGNLILISRKKQ
jgi:ferric-dicitrate binding protein FerR (iron transport regulator)